MTKALQILTGKFFGNLFVTARADDTPKGRSRWKCLCGCGKFTYVSGDNLRSGGTLSCGCWRKKMMSKRQKTHGLSKTAIYGIWSKIKQRCYSPNNPHYRDYGSRGIIMSDSWKNSFDVFMEDMGPRPSLKHSVERINVNGNYEKSNCVWALPKDQANNRRNNKKYLYNDQMLTIPEIGRLTGIHKDTIHYRLKTGDTLEEALAKSLRKTSK